MDLGIKSRIFGTSPSIESKLAQIPNNNPQNLNEILELLAHEQLAKKAFIFKEEERKPIEELQEQEIHVENDGKEEKPKILLYEVAKDTYFVYKRQEEPSIYARENNDKSTDVYVPTGVTVRRVPSHILGNGVLGRAFIYSNYIEILDSLLGNEYLEVLTHEVMHIRYPEKREMEIRQITKNYLGDKTIYH
jgi:hypothetical protein